jgi:hypothetical protein
VNIVDTSDARPRGLWSSVRQISNNTNGTTEKKQYDNTNDIVLDVWRGIGNQVYLIANRDSYPNKEIFLVYGVAYWAIQQGLSMDNLTKLPPYMPDSLSTAKWTSQANPQVQEETTIQRVVDDSIKSAGIVTPPPDYFFRDQEEKQHGDCRPNAAIATIWYIVQRYQNHFWMELLPTTATEFWERMTDLLSTETLVHKAQLYQPIIGLQEEIQWGINTWRHETGTLHDNQTLYTLLRQTEERSANKRALYIGSIICSLTVWAILSEDLITTTTMPLSFPKEGPTQHPPWYGKYRPEVEYLCLLIKDQIHMETAVQQFSTQFNVVVIDSHRVHYVTYYRYQQANPTATNKSSPSHHQSAEQWLTQLTKMRNCTPTKRPHQAERDKTTGIYIYTRGLAEETTPHLLPD